jgi:hypothetical protein
MKRNVLLNNAEIEEECVLLNNTEIEENIAKNVFEEGK